MVMIRLSLKERLRQVTGVWIGTYTHVTPKGEILDTFTSRQETHLEGDDWYERVTYMWPEGEAIQFDFHAQFDQTGEQIVFDDPNFHGEIKFVNDKVYVFPYYWKAKPDTHVVETIVLASVHYKSRVWQTFECNQLAKVTIITEQRINALPELWYLPKYIAN
jgi:hypothetical protein